MDYYYTFGMLFFEGRRYTSDVIFMADGGKLERVVDRWWREEGHYLRESDLFEVWEYKPDVLVVGTGKYGRMSVDEGVYEKVKELGISIVAHETDKALEEFYRRFVNGARVAGAFHLTC